MAKVTVREYDDGFSIRAALGDNESYVDFAIIGDDEEAEISGSVKWDGCINWETNPACMMHFCGPSDADRLAALFKDVWEEARKLMPHADFD
jgi:hypothetical protein